MNNENEITQKVVKNIRKENKELRTKNLTRTIILFAILTITGVSFVVFGQDASLSTFRYTLPLLGAAMFASALTFFMVDLTR
jgi:hypothetical protein